MTGLRNTRLLQTKWLQHTRNLSSAISLRSGILEPVICDKLPEKGDSVAILSDKTFIAQDTIGARNPIPLKERSVDISDWGKQRQFLFQDSGTGRNKKLKQNTALGNTRPNKKVQTPTSEDDKNRSTTSVVPLDPEQNETLREIKRIYDSQPEQDPIYNEREPHNSLTKGLTAGRQKDRWRNRGPLSSLPNVVQSSNSPASNSEPVPLRKKDRWRNRISSSECVKPNIVDKKISKGFAGDLAPRPARQIDKSQDQSSDQSTAGMSSHSDLTGKKPKESVADLPAWKVHKRAVKAKLGDQAWKPLKRLSPDAREGVRQLHSENPTLWSTENLANHFQLSPDAIRRIIKSSWKPTENEREEQRERWIRRGETIWNRYVEIGYKAPRKWRGLNPIPATKSSSAYGATEFKPEEWSKDQVEESEQSGGLVSGLENRIT
ncbi:MAG: hypothetical protein GOMPHAMPRED_003560 [Gomphillus americanus]|uniref:Required for respiratory growth protein 9, mitochondrial n=1 Tax=Gomphillus americanus TaxID=1940652 RepID=A0A8H3ISC2_9LECA|nr:MAG: hypothetical protein GOMPHAMPRED_003560 [Gomphillus americanus]